MEVVFKCPHCKSTIEADSELTGVRAECPACNEIVLVPAPGIELGMVLGGFQLERRLGVGGMGEVFAAKQLAMDRSVALKILPPALTDDERQVNRFLHEVRMAAKLEHTNIVTAFDAGKADGYYYLAMSFVEGEDLDHKLKRDKRLQEAEALEVVVKIASALEYAWTRFQMLHRDIKPANIMIDSDGEVKLMDMGIAKSLEEDSNLTMQGTLVGTPYYMSPEQATAKQDIDCRSDIYSLGATLYHLVSGRRPHEGPNAMAIIAKHISETPKPISELNSELTPGTCQLIERMMARNREDRHADWGELQRDVIRMMSGAPTLADAIPPVALAAAASAATVIEPPPVGSADTQEKLGITLDDNLGLKPKTVEEPPLVAAPTVATPPQPAIQSDSILEGGAAAEDVKGFKAGIFMAAAAAVMLILVLGAIIYFIAANVGRDTEQLKVAKRDQDLRDKELDVDIANKLIKHEMRNEEKAEEMLQGAHAYAQEFPDEVDKIKARFGKVKEFAEINKLPEYELKAEDDLRELLAKKKKEVGRVDEVMSELQNRARVLSKQYQIIPAALVFEGYKGALASETQRDRDSYAKLYYKRAKQLRPLEETLRKALRLLGQGRTAELDTLMRSFRDNSDLDKDDPVVKANLLHLFLVARGHTPRRRGSRRPDTGRGEAKGPFIKAFHLYKQDKLELALNELDGMKNLLLAQIIRGEIRAKQAQGYWKSTSFSGPGYTSKIRSISLKLDGGNVEVKADGKPYFSGKGWFLGDWLYMQNGAAMKCWRLDSASRERVILIPVEGVKMTMTR